MTNDDELRILEVLEKIHRGKLAVAPIEKIVEQNFFGDVTYTISNGWSITVFIDGGEFDYVDCVTVSDGTVYDFDEIWSLAEKKDGTITPRKDGWNRLRNYRGCICDLKGLCKHSLKERKAIQHKIWKIDESSVDIIDLSISKKSK